MATVTGLTAARMLAIEAASIVDGEINGSGHLILTTHGGTQIDAGSAIGTVPEQDVVKYLVPASFVQATLPAAYPMGISLLYLSSADATAGGWTNFTTKWGTVRTVKPDGGDDIAQIWMHHHDETAEPELWIRGGNWSGWSEWRKLATTVVTDALDIRLDTLEGARTFTPTLAESALESAYPLGVSVMSVSSGDAWSRGSSGIVVTHRYNDSRTYQIFNDTNHRLWTRRYITSSGGWGSWDILQNDEVVIGGELTVGQWYRIATIPSGTVKASAEFVLSTDVVHNLVRFRASAVFNSTRSSLMLQECSGLDATSLLSQIRIVALDGTSGGGHALDVLIQTFSTSGLGSIRMQVKHDDWKGSSGALATNRWGTLSLSTTTPASPVAPATILMRCGVGYTGDFIAPSAFSNSWVDIGGSQFSPAGYRMEPGSLVRLNGLIKNGTIPSVAFTLPVGYRPPFDKVYAVPTGSNVTGRVDVQADGDVFISGGNNSFVSLDGIVFRAIQ
jgi:hypothetical protein